MAFDHISHAEIEAYASTRGAKVVGAIETSVAWPTVKQLVGFDGARLLLIPGERQPEPGRHTLPAIALETTSQGIDETAARVRILEFSSALAWREGQDLEVVGWSGGNLPRSFGVRRMETIADSFEARHLPLNPTDAARTAMAFYREGISLSNPFYAYLSLYKAFSVALPDQRTRGAWIASALPQLSSGRAIARRNTLQQQGVDISTYLYNDNRHAIAHGDRAQIVNPDRDDDRRRLELDVPLMRELAELAIEHSLGVERAITQYRHHRYELAGFRQRMSAQQLAAIVRGNAVEGTVELPDRLALVARRGDCIEVLSPITEFELECDPPAVILRVRSPEGAAIFPLRLDFQSDRLEFDPIPNLERLRQIATKRQALDAAAVERFVACLYRNGRVEVWDDVGETRLGQSQPYLPFNVRINFDEVEAGIARLDALAATLE